MNSKDLYSSFSKVDDDILERSEFVAHKKTIKWKPWLALAASVCFVMVTFTMILLSGQEQHDPQLGEITLSEKTTAKVSYGYEVSAATASKPDLIYLTEQEMFAHDNMYIFRGKVSGLTNVTIDFNGEIEVRCIAAIVVNEVYKGDLVVGETVTMLIPCAIDSRGIVVEDTGVIAQLENGMEGIFMPWIYSEDSYMELNGAVLMHQDLAACGLADGMRWAFLSTERGIVFLRSAYPGVGDATNLDDIEAYVIEMLD